MKILVKIPETRAVYLFNAEKGGILFELLQLQRGGCELASSQ